MQIKIMSKIIMTSKLKGICLTDPIILFYLPLCYLFTLAYSYQQNTYILIANTSFSLE